MTSTTHAPEPARVTGYAETTYLPGAGLWLVAGSAPSWDLSDARRRHPLVEIHSARRALVVLAADHAEHLARSLPDVVRAAYQSAAALRPDRIGSHREHV